MDNENEALPLVPDWVEELDPGTCWRLDGRIVLVWSERENRASPYQAPGLTYEQWCDLWKPMQWAKEHGRLPTREDQAPDRRGRGWGGLSWAIPITRCWDCGEKQFLGSDCARCNFKGQLKSLQSQLAQARAELERVMNFVRELADGDPSTVLASAQRMAVAFVNQAAGREQRDE